MEMTAHHKKQSLPLMASLLRFISLFWLLLVSYAGTSQNITLSLKEAPLEKAFRQIEANVKQRFVYTSEMLEQSHPVSIEVRNASLQEVLQLVFENQPLEFLIDQNFIKVRYKARPAAPVSNGIAIKGVVLGADNNALMGATVLVKGKSLAAVTNENGVFNLNGVSKNDILIISNIGYTAKEVPVKGRSYMEINLTLSVTPLDETVVIAYGTTTRRLNTGSVGKVTAEEIARQPVSNPLAALQGRIPGLVITQSSGLNGAGFSVQIRGQNSILQGSEPLFVIDGVPFSAGNAAINQLTNATNIAGLSPLNLINPADIESIEVLKDADATAIYGSRGANGVILITTKKGKAGATKFNMNLYTGWSKVTRTMDMLNTKQYVDMRREAFQNDGIIPDQSNAPDLLLWDTTRYTDLKEPLIGGTARTTDAQMSLSGGTTMTQFLIGGGFHHETTVFPTDLGDQKASVHINLSHHPGKRFSVNFTGNYIADKNELHFGDPTRFVALPPNIRLYDSLNKLNWQEGGVMYSSILGENANPLANLNTRYIGNFSNLISNLQLGYKILPDLKLKLNLGYNSINSDEKELNPSTSLDPNSGQLPYSYFGKGSIKSWIVEPQVEYNRKVGKGKLNVLLGATAQENVNSGIYVSAFDYSSDIFLNAISGAAYVTTSNSYLQYRYNALFGRINYNWNDQFIGNLTGRRDGSSRFGPNTRFSNFGAFGFAWIFSNTKKFQKQFPFISYGKVRSSYGVTGNDQIGDYRFIDTWSVSPFTYQEITALSPTALYNPDYEWEVNKKFEIAIELGFLKDRILLSSSYYRNRSGNQIVQYTLPTQTGFSFIGKNLAATVQNTGFELQLTSKNIANKNFTWATYFNIALTRNKLLSFPGLATSSYATIYTIGEPLSARKVYPYLGIDTSGVYQFADVNKDGKLDKNDRVRLTDIHPDFYGGIQNIFSFKGMQLSFLLEFKKQKGLNYLNTLNGYVPGTMHNQPSVVLSRWQKPGDITDIQKFTAIYGTPAYNSGQFYLGLSEAIYGDASYVRCKNVSLSCNIPETWLSKIDLEGGRIYLQAQNLFTITGYVGADPENQNMLVLPPLKTISAGVQLNF